MNGFLLCLLVVSTRFVDGYDCQLYSEEDDVACMTNSSVVETVLGSDYCWIVEFYASWCGHCQYFAPKWKEFAHSIKNWSTVARVGIIDCGDRQNTVACQHFQLQGFPTVKLFYAHSNKSEVGAPVHDRNMNDLRHAVLKHVESQHKPPPSWPLLSPVTNVQTVKQWMLSHADGRVFLVLEEDDSFLGRELIMEMYSRTRVLIRRAVSSRSDVTAFCGVAVFPALILISDGKLAKLKTTANDLTSYKTAVLSVLKNHQAGGKAAGDNSIVIVADKKKPVIIPPQMVNKGHHTKVQSHGEQQLGERKRKPAHSIKPSVYSEDLMATLTFSFLHEIPLHDLSGSRFKTLTHFVDVLSSCLPVPMTTRRLLDQLSSRLKLIDLKSKKIDVSTWMRLIRHESAGLQSVDNWVACKGSQPHYRGYPCGLWTLFHTVVTNCARYDPTLQKTCSQWIWRRPQTKPFRVVPGSKRMDITQVLFAIRDYIRDFFGCRQCSDNFSKMAVEISKEVASASDGVLWLWRAHNRANLRLQNAESSDPEHPKIQFPSALQCPQCYPTQTKANTDNGVHWNEKAVLCFVTDMYRFESIRTASQVPVVQQPVVWRPVITHGIRIRPRFSNISPKETVDIDIHTPLFYGMDWKFCLFLYFVSMVVIVYVGRTLMRSRGCKRKRKRFNPA